MEKHYAMRVSGKYVKHMFEMIRFNVLCDMLKLILNGR